MSVVRCESTIHSIANANTIPILAQDSQLGKNSTACHVMPLLNAKLSFHGRNTILPIITISLATWTWPHDHVQQDSYHSANSAQPLVRRCDMIGDSARDAIYQSHTAIIGKRVVYSSEFSYTQTSCNHISSPIFWNRHSAMNPTVDVASRRW